MHTLTAAICNACIDLEYLGPNGFHALSCPRRFILANRHLFLVVLGSVILMPANRISGTCAFVSIRTKKPLTIQFSYLSSIVQFINV